MEEVTAFVAHIVRELVDKPDDVVAKAKVGEGGIMVTLAVAPDDMGYVIGKNGNTIGALRVLSRGFAAKHRKFVTVEVLEPEQV